MALSVWAGGTEKVNLCQKLSDRKVKIEGASDVEKCADHFWSFSEKCHLAWFGCEERETCPQIGFPANSLSIFKNPYYIEIILFS